MGQGNDVDKVLGPLEADIMRVVWATAEPVTVRDVLGRLNADRKPPLAYTTVMTVMSRLAEKAILHRERIGRGYQYRAAAPDAATIAVREVFRDFGVTAVAGFVDEARGDPRLLRRLRKLLEDG